MLQICRTSPGFVPIVTRGQLHPIREPTIAGYPVSSDTSMEDLVLELEVLGCRISRNEDGDVVVRELEAFVRDVWRIRARQIQACLTDDLSGTRSQVSIYLGSRDQR